MSTPQPSRREPAGRRFDHRIVVAAAVFLALIFAGLPARPGLAQGDEEAADPRQQLRSERALVTGRLGEVEAALTAANQAVATSELALTELQAERVQVDEGITATRAAREQPLAVRRAIAIEVYMAGDPAANSIIEELAEGSGGIDGVRDRALYSSVVDWASSNLDRLDAELGDLLGRLDELDDEIPQLEDQLSAQREVAATELAARDALVAQIAEIDERLRALNRSILTGLETDQVQTRPILVVKIDNVSGARPQQGLEAADIVIEEKVESGLTRLAALFQSTVADPVGPVRSARTSDIHLLANLGAPLFAYSGANLGVGGALAASSLVDVGATKLSGQYYRESSRRAPHNLYSRTSRLWAAGEGASPPRAVFEFRESGQSIGAGSRPSAGVDVDYGSARASFRWAADRNGWARTMDGRPHTVVGGAQIAPENVVVRFIDYVPSPADARSPEAVVTGSGPLWVFSGGHVVEGRWEQDSPASPTRWLDSEGNPIRLTPGRTWILLPSAGDAAIR